MSNAEFNQVTADEWAEIMSNYRVYSSEGTTEHGLSVMYCTLAYGHMKGTIIGKVIYLKDICIGPDRIYLVHPLVIAETGLPVAQLAY